MAFRESKILKELLQALKPEKKCYEVMDTVLNGFGVRVSPKGKVSYILRWSLHCRDGSGTLGAFPAMPVAAARKKAENWRGMIARGEDPRAERKRLRAAQSMKEFLTDWLAKHVINLAAKTRKDYTRIVKKVLIPALGTRMVEDVTEKDGLELKQALAEHHRSANMALSVASSAMTSAEAWGQRAKGTNPFMHIERFGEEELTRSLDEEEMAAFAAFLDRNEEAHALPVAQLRLLLMTGARLGEVKRLEWPWVDLEGGIIRVPKGQHKTGKKTGKDRLIALGPHAIDLLQDRSTRKLSKWVFPGNDGPYSGLESWWQRRRKTELAKIGLGDFHIHDLRHTFATIARLKGLDLDDVGDLLGHTTSRQTRRYAHIMAKKLREDALKAEGGLPAGMAGVGAS